MCLLHRGKGRDVIKRLAALGSVGALWGLSFFAAPGAHAGTCDPGTSNGRDPSQVAVPTPADGATLYAAGSPAGGGYAGVTGNSGYLEASGNPSTQQAAVYGSTTDGSVTGQANVSSSGPGVCANGVTAP